MEYSAVFFPNPTEMNPPKYVENKWNKKSYILDSIVPCNDCLFFWFRVSLFLSFPTPPPPFFFFFFFQLLNSSRSGYLCIHLFFSIFLGYFFPSCFFAFLFFFFKMKCPFIQNYTIYIFYFLIFFFQPNKKVFHFFTFWPSQPNTIREN